MIRKFRKVKLGLSF